MREILKSERGEVMIEAALYFPIVIIFVFMIIILSMFIMQNSLKQYANDKAADMAAKNLCLEGYSGFYSDSSQLSGENVAIPSEAEVTNYYIYRQTDAVLYRNNYYTSINRIYQNISGLKRKYSIFYTTYGEINMDYNSELDRTVSYGDCSAYYIPFFSSDEYDLGLNNTTKTYATNPADLVRVTDAANESASDINIGMSVRGIWLNTMTGRYNTLRNTR